MRDNAITENNHTIDPSPRQTQISEPTDDPVANKSQTATNYRLRQNLPFVLTTAAFLITQQVHADNGEASGPNHDETGSNSSGYSKPLDTDTSPLLLSVSSLACSANSEEASSALSPLESNFIESWQLPNEWNGLDRPPALYAGSLDIAIANLIATAEKYPELQNRIDALLLSWNYCHVIGRDTFYDLPDQSGSYPDGLAGAGNTLKRPAGESPLGWSGFQRLGIHPTEHSLIDDLTSSESRYIPGLTLEVQKIPSYREESFWREHTRQCLPHPTTGRMYFVPRPFGPTRIDLSFLNQLVAEPYPFGWNHSCGIEKDSEFNSPTQEPAESLKTDAPAETEYTEVPDSSADIETPAIAAGNENTETEEETPEVITQTSAADVELQGSGEPAPPVENNNQDRGTIEVSRKLPPSDTEALKIGKQKRLSEFKIRLINASRDSATLNKITGEAEAETKLQAIEAAIAQASVKQEQPVSPQQGNPEIAAALPELTSTEPDIDGATSYQASQVTLDSYRESLAASEKIEKLARLEKAKRLSVTKASRVRLSRNSSQTQSTDVASIPDTTLSPLTAQNELTKEPTADQEASRTLTEKIIEKERSKRLQGLKVARVLLSRAVAAAEKQRIADLSRRKNNLAATKTTNANKTPVSVLSPFGITGGSNSIETTADTAKPRLPGTHTPPDVLVLSARPGPVKKFLATNRPKVLVLSAIGNSGVNDTNVSKIASNRQTEIEYKRQQSKRLQATKRQRVRLSRSNKVQVAVNPKETVTSTVLARREKSKRLHAVKIWRVILSRQFKQRKDQNLHTDVPGTQSFPGRRTEHFSPADSSRLAFRQMLEQARNNPDHQEDNGASYAYAYRSGRRYMTTATIWRVLLSREFAARAQIPGWKSAYTYNLSSSNSPAARASRRRHGLRIWGEQWFGFRDGNTHVNRYASGATGAEDSSTPGTSNTTNITVPDNSKATLDSSILISAIDTEQSIQALEPSTETPEIGAAVQSIATAGATPGNSISPVSNAPPYRAPENSADTSHGFSGSFTLNNTELEFGDTDHYSLTSQIAYKPVKDSYFFARTGITVNNSDEPLTYTWGVGYDDWHPGTWGFEINNWNPLRPGDGLDLDNAIVSLSRKFAWKKLADHNLASSLSLNKSVNSDFALTWLISYAPVENWFVRTLLTQSLEGDGLSWAYGFGYNNWRKNTVAIEYNNWGFNEAFDTNFKDNAIVTISYKWEW